MLVAKMKDGRFILLRHEANRANLHELRKTHTFYCPACQNEVVLKIGQMKTPHFAHIRKTNCDDLFSENESEAHITGKVQLYEHFVDNYPSTVLEPFISTLKQRPDLLIEQKGLNFAIEYQCSPLAIFRFEERTKGYKDEGFEPVWIFKTEESWHVDRTGFQVIKIPLYIQMAIQHFSNQTYFVTYCPRRQQFYYAMGLARISSTTFLANFLPFSLKNQRLPFALPAPLTDGLFNARYTAFRHATERWIQSTLLHNHQGVRNRFLRLAYEARYQPNHAMFPIGIPIYKAEAIGMPVCEWQLALFRYHTNYVYSREEVRRFITQKNWRILHEEHALEAVWTYTLVIREWTKHQFTIDEQDASTVLLRIVQKIEKIKEEQKGELFW